MVCDIFKKISFCIIVLIMLMAIGGFHLLSADSHLEYKDVSEKNSHYDAIIALTEQGVIEGYQNGEFGVWDSVQRMQVAVMLADVLELETPDNVSEILKAYSDIDKDFIYAEEVAAVTEADIFIGSDDGKFNPVDYMTREQMASVLESGFALDTYDTGGDVMARLAEVSPSHKNSVQCLLNLGISVEPDYFQPKTGTSRGAFASMLYRTQQMVTNPDTNDKLNIQAIDPITNDQIHVVFQGTDHDVKIELDHGLDPGGNTVAFHYKNHKYTAEVMYDQSLEEQVIELTNKKRANHGLDPLKRDEKLANAAQIKAHDMSVHQYFDHYSPSIGTLSNLLEQEKVDYWTDAGENIAKNYKTPESVMNGWMNSEGHRENILNPDYDHVGVGFSEEGNYWTQEFIKKK